MSRSARIAIVGAFNARRRVAGGRSMRAKVSSIELGGATNLAVMAPIRAGFVPGFETITYLERLRRLLDALHAARRNLRESELLQPAFLDPIGRFGIIHSFRYAIVPPAPDAAAAADPGVSRLSLNVTFDGGWEPYMRVIFRDIGTLLDALFCHCTGYPGSRTATFDAYCRWVRDNEIGGGTFYFDSALTLADQRYLERVERIQRESADPLDADRRIAGLAVEPEHRQVARSVAAAVRNPALLALSVRTLKGLYRLAPFFARNADRDDLVLLRFAQSVLQEFREVIAIDAFRESEPWKPFEAVLADELAWLRRRTPPPPRAKRPDFAPAALQAAILGATKDVSHGCVVLLRVRAADAAAGHLASLAPKCALAAGVDRVQYHVAFTYAGLRSLGIPAQRLDALSQEFIEGMEARCGTLGDVRGNHPDQWARPLRDRAGAPPNGERIDLSTVHVVVVLRLADPGDDRPTLHPKLAAAVDAMRGAHTGLVVLSVQPTRSTRDGAGATREHFGFVDGLSQPRVATTPAPRSDEVSPGELLLGHANDRGDDPFPDPLDRLLHNGSYLVMRKLRQRSDHLGAVLAAHPAPQELLAKMMGRRQDGTPLVALRPGGDANAFDYDADPNGAACPLHSHIRRANPRDGRPVLPRLLRRGMSYGARADADPQGERGIVFMAYCASIAEQFETIQRWIAGGNSSGGSSAQADPFLGVPQLGEKRVFRYIDAAGHVARVDLGDKPFVQLEWGLYLFAPSLQALSMLAEFRRTGAEPQPEQRKARPPEPLEAWRGRLEDPDRSKATWAEVRAQPDGRMSTPYGVLIGTPQGVLDVLGDAAARRYSVQGYGDRMAASIGLNHLGMDPAGGHSQQAPPANAVIERIDERAAFDAATPFVTKALAGFAVFRQQLPGGPVKVPVDLITLSEHVLAALCTHWFGLPDGAAGATPLMVVGGRVDDAQGVPRCPGHLFTASRSVFAPHPRPDVIDAGRAQGRAVLDAVVALLASGRPLAPLAAEIRSGLNGVDDEREPSAVARSIAGMLLGFPPTVHGNFLRTLETWIDEGTLWTWQQHLAEVPAAITDLFSRARQALREPLLTTMRERPVPEMLWRSPVVDGRVVHDPQQRIVLGIASALTERSAPDELMFGGSRCGRSKTKTLHACPGYGMGIGVLLALIAGLLGAGTLRPTGSPVLLMLTPHAN
jgi:Dyp-type peroxidase family